MNRALVETIKERVSIVDIVSRYIKLLPAGAQMKGLCPLHGEKTPSFYVSPSRGTWKCFGCSKGGDVISFVQEIEHLSFREAIQNLAEGAGIAIESKDLQSSEIDEVSQLYTIMSRSAQIYHEALLKNPAAIQYLKSRGVTQESIQKFQIGYAPDAWQHVSADLERVYTREQCILSGVSIQGKQGIYDRFRSRIIFPTRDVRDRVVTFSGRIWSENGNYTTERDTSGKYINGPETLIYKKSKTLYGLSEARIAISQKKRAILVEGHLDCVMSHQTGYTETIALAGTALTQDHTALLQRFCDEVIICLDADSAGQKATARSVAILYESGFSVYVANLSPGDDPADVIVARPQEYHDAIDGAVEYVIARIGQMKSNHIDIRQAEKIITSEIYPIIAFQKNPLYRDRDLSHIATYLNTSIETVRDHMKLYLNKQNPTGVNNQPASQYSDKSSQGILTHAEKLATVWSALIDANTQHSISEYLNSATGIVHRDLADFILYHSIPDQDYTLSYVACYSDHPPSGVVSECLSQYCSNFLKGKKQNIMTGSDYTEGEKMQMIKQLLEYEEYTKTKPYAYKI